MDMYYNIYTIIKKLETLAVLSISRSKLMVLERVQEQIQVQIQSNSRSR